LFVEVMLKIYGPSGFTASEKDQVLGRFNDAIRGRAMILFDEVMFSGDRRAADALKSLATDTIRGIETKNLPTINCPVGVNCFLLSNHSNAAYIEEHDARYWTLNASPHRFGDTRYFESLAHEIKHGGREAFAHYLLHLDVRDFVPWRDVPMKNAAKCEMIRQSINPYDARKWLADCCAVERVVGMRDGDGADRLWEEGHEIPFAALRNAYVAWQKDVRTRGSAEPTELGALGVVLSKYGFVSRKGSGGIRVSKLPAVEACHAELRKPQP
jgi:hypothetical protein